jgi:hypothetical protein
MKKRNLFIYAALIWVAACSPKPAETEVPTENADEVDLSQNEFIFSEETKIAILADPFTLDATKEAAFNYLSKESLLKELELSNHFSGIFDAKYFIPEKGKAGIRFWYCYDSLSPTKFFLALEQVDKIDSVYHPEDISDLKGKKLRIPLVENYPSNYSLDTPSIKKYFLEHKHSSPLLEKDTLDFIKVINFSLRFKNLMIDKIPKFGYLPTKYAVAIFEFNESYNDFINQNPSKIMYVMGYMKDTKHSPNYLRPILVGIRNDGLTILNRNDLKIPTFLQRSVPPPPIQ